MFAIIVASVGLNVNSTAVIIGAMLISPLMGPIDSLYNRMQMGRQLLHEIKPLYPQLTSCSYSEAMLFASNDSIAAPALARVVTFGLQGSALKDAERAKIDSWLQVRLRTEEVKVYYQVEK
jgi:hypothetical protein